MLPALISTQDLAAMLDDGNVCLFDASLPRPGENTNCALAYANCHIQGAQFFDIKTLSDAHNPLPHMLPNAEDFTAAMRHFGLRQNQPVVVYDQMGLFSAARAWWMLRVFGHENVAVLDGGLPKWLAEARATSNQPPRIGQSGNFIARFQPQLIADKQQILTNLHGPTAQLLDARSAARFVGAEPDPWPQRLPGHIPGSVNVAYASLLQPNKTLRPAVELKQIFAEAGIDITAPIIASCGTGVTACILALALQQLGRAHVAIYDGSWAEWGLASLALPIALGGATSPK